MTAPVRQLKSLFYGVNWFMGLETIRLTAALGLDILLDDRALFPDKSNICLIISPAYPCRSMQSTIMNYLSSKSKWSRLAKEHEDKSRASMLVESFDDWILKRLANGQNLHYHNSFKVRRTMQIRLAPLQWSDSIFAPICADK